MKKTIKYTDGEIQDFSVVEDFLPSPKELAFHLTIIVTLQSLDVFMINNSGIKGLSSFLTCE